MLLSTAQTKVNGDATQLQVYGDTKIELLENTTVFVHALLYMSDKRILNKSMRHKPIKIDSDSWTMLKALQKHKCKYYLIPIWNCK